MHKLTYVILLLTAATASHAQDFKSYPLQGARESPQFVLGTCQQSWAGGYSTGTTTLSISPSTCPLLR